MQKFLNEDSQNWPNKYTNDKYNIPGGIYLFKVKNGNTRTKCEIYSKLFIANF